MSERRDERPTMEQPGAASDARGVEVVATETVEGYVLLKAAEPSAISDPAREYENPVALDAAPFPAQDEEGARPSPQQEEEPRPAVKVGPASETETAEQENPSPPAPVASSSEVGSNRRRKAEPALRVRRIAIEEGWRDRVSLVMDRDKPAGHSTPIGVVMDLSSAVSVELVEDGAAIEVKGWEWQNLQEAEALIRLLFRDYRDGYSWWFYSVPSFSALCISNTVGTSVPELSDEEGKGLRVSIAPYDENATRRAFFITCPTNAPVDEAYQIIKHGWNYWRVQPLEMQINRVMGILYGVHIQNIKPDGNCLFRAFAVAQLQDEEAHMTVRQAVVDFMRGSDELRSFIAIDDDAEDDPDFVEKYLAEMEKPTTWGDQVEITAFTRVYKRPVRVFSYNFHESRLVNVYTATENAEDDLGPEVKLLHLWGHYSLLSDGVAELNIRWNIATKAMEEQKGEAPVLAASSSEDGEEATAPDDLVTQRAASDSSLEGSQALLDEEDEEGEERQQASRLLLEDEE